MSFRTYIGEKAWEWADYNSVDYPTTEELTDAAAWHLPAKLYWQSGMKLAADRFLQVLADRHSMKEDDFWVISEWTPTEQE